MKKYNKHYVKRDPSDLSVMIEGGNPILGDIAKSDCPLEDRHVKILNKDWRKTGIYFTKVETENKVKSDVRLALEDEATELGIKFRDNIGDDKLQEKINQAIEN